MTNSTSPPGRTPTRPTLHQRLMNSVSVSASMYQAARIDSHSPLRARDLHPGVAAAVANQPKRPQNNERAGRPLNSWMAFRGKVIVLP